VAVLVPLLPYLLNGAPFIGDSWVHFSIAKSTIASGKYSIAGYNERWPLVNLLLSVTAILTGLPEFYAGAVVPILVGLASIPLYSFCRRLGLPPIGALGAIVFLTFNPLYSYITFAGSVMKETSTYYLIFTMLLLTSILLKHGCPKNATIAMMLIGLGVTLGHHYGALVTLLFLWALTGYSILGSLTGESSSFKGIAVGTLGFTFIAGTWNILNYLALGAYFPVFDVRDSTLLVAAFIVTWAVLAVERGSSFLLWPWLALLAFLIVIMGLRGGLYLLQQPVEPISIWEWRNYIIVGAFTLVGLAIGLRSTTLKAFSASALSLVLFAFIWGLTYPAFVLLIKSIHYFGIPLAVGAGFASAALVQKGALGKVLVTILLIFTIYASWHGTELALNGLGAYHQGELWAASNLPQLSSEMKVFGDTKASYLMPYAAGINPLGLPLQETSASKLFLLFKPNLEQGFLLGYDWVPTEAIIPRSRMNSWNRVFDGEYLKLIQE